SVVSFSSVRPASNTFALEPNPFEQSFGAIPPNNGPASSSSPSISNNHAHGHPHGHSSNGNRNWRDAPERQ
ncbi:hypothetical protein KEM54_005059, partial [Ascosphaera aggregata]